MFSETLAEKLAWYSVVEMRRWKQVIDAIQFWVIAVVAFAVIGVINVYGDGTALQPIFTLFVGFVGFAAGCLGFSVIRGGALKRWQVQVVMVGFGAAVGLAAVAGFLMLEVQTIRANN